jgi:hypothetical protein
MYVLGNSGLDINRYSLSTPWDISTAVFYNNFYVGFQEIGPQGMYIDRSNGVAYVVGTSSDRVFQYNTETDGVELVSQSGLFIDGSLYANKNLVVTSDARIDGTLRVSGTISAPVAATSLTASSTVTFSTTSQVITIGNATTTGTIVLGGAAQTGLITLGRSTVTHTLNIDAGATLSGNTKTINIGTSGVSGSITNINLGSAVSGAVGNTSIQNNLIYDKLIATGASAPTVASATTITPTTQIVFVSGTTAIATITPPSPISAGGGQITIIPTGVFTTTTAGNIALASTAVVNRALIMTYNAATNKWYPSY